MENDISDYFNQPGCRENIKCMKEKTSVKQSLLKKLAEEARSGSLVTGL